jgi:hypothetical protein
MKFHAAILQSGVPPELLEVLADYLQQDGALRYFYCTGIEPLGSFFVFEAVKSKGDKKPWPIRMSSSHILAVVDVTEKGPPLGFP